MIKKLSFAAVIAALLVVVINACKKEDVSVTVEPKKDIAGSWKIIKATRNGTDMTARFDFSKFRISFSDSNYTISNPVPFIVGGNGSWRFDDAQFPFLLSFRATGDTLKRSEIQYPVTKGVRNIILSFSPGCKANSYQYTLEKEN